MDNAVRVLAFYLRRIVFATGPLRLYDFVIGTLLGFFSSTCSKHARYSSNSRARDLLV